MDDRMPIFPLFAPARPFLAFGVVPAPFFPPPASLFAIFVPAGFFLAKVLISVYQYI
jgi:hypothetical protein